MTNPETCFIRNIRRGKQQEHWKKTEHFIGIKNKNDDLVLRIDNL